MVRSLRIPNPGIPGSKSLGGSKYDLSFYPSEVDQISTRNSWELKVKSKISPGNGSVTLRKLNPIHKKEPKILSFKKTCIICLLRLNTPLLVTESFFSKRS